jgi:hypothetical protein
VIEIVVGILAVIIAALGAEERGAALAVHDKLVEPEPEEKQD